VNTDRRLLLTLCSPERMSASYDGIILGTGHNALVLHAYLARSGLRILSLDRAPVPGGGLATEENPRRPGFCHNTHSFFRPRGTLSRSR
jgi:phytoene dehydrogenase-like protein